MPRKYVLWACWLRGVVAGFNEAGADAPEIHPTTSPPDRRRECFNEAGADAPEIPP